jgi:hypothetical protein
MRGNFSRDEGRPGILFDFKFAFLKVFQRDRSGAQLVKMEWWRTSSWASFSIFGDGFMAARTTSSKRYIILSRR